MGAFFFVVLALMVLFTFGFVPMLCFYLGCTLVILLDAFDL